MSPGHETSQRHDFSATIGVQLWHAICISTLVRRILQAVRPVQDARRTWKHPDWDPHWHDLRDPGRRDSSHLQWCCRVGTDSTGIAAPIRCRQVGSMCELIAARRRRGATHASVHSVDCRISQENVGLDVTLELHIDFAWRSNRREDPRNRWTTWCWPHHYGSAWLDSRKIASHKLTSVGRRSDPRPWVGGEMVEVGLHAPYLMCDVTTTHGSRLRAAWIIRPRDFEFAHLVLECGSLEPETLCCTVCPAYLSRRTV